jgi:hypothetical protein
MTLPTLPERLARLVADLRAAGVQVLDKDPETGRQWSVSAVRGHFGGSMDATAIGVLEAPKTWHLVEFKTHGNKSFGELKKKEGTRAERKALRRPETGPARSLLWWDKRLWYYCCKRQCH